ncbi:MAG: glycosyltransferase family A protein [Nitrosomonas sp.]
MNSYDVVIPCYNGADTVLIAVHSALDCPGVSRVIVVDDGSTDDSLALLRSVGDARVQVEHQANGGPGSARNRGATLAATARLIFLDADDALIPNAVLVFETFPSAEVVRSGAVRVFPDGSEDVDFAKSDPRPFPRGAPLCGSFSISRSLFARIGGYDERLGYGENTELLLRAGQVMGGMDKIPCEAQPTVRVNYEPARNSDYYRRSRIAAINLVSAKHPCLLKHDPDTRRNYNAIASVLLRAEGDRRGALLAAVRAAMVWRPEPRACLRALKAALEVVGVRQS